MKVGDIDVSGSGLPTILTDEGLRPCDGRLVSRKKNPNLYHRIGHCHSDEDARCCNAELFNLPDLTGKQPSWQ